MLRCTVGLSLLLLAQSMFVGCGDSSAPAAVRLSASESPAAEKAESSPAEDSSTAAKPAAAPTVTLASAAAEPNEEAKPQEMGRILDRGFDDIKFEMDKEEPFVREMLTEEIEKLVGQKIRIRGYILPTSRSKGLRKFVLVRDNMECCFGPGAALFDCILIEMEPGLTAEFSIRPIAVEGVFDVRELMGPDGKHLAIYHLRASSAG